MKLNNLRPAKNSVKKNKRELAGVVGQVMERHPVVGRMDKIHAQVVG